jgi:hypothetical protein
MHVSMLYNKRETKMKSWGYEEFKEEIAFELRPHLVTFNLPSQTLEHVFKRVLHESMFLSL